jgi:GH25 family lysozyme M1 (1,4-beta-N-acetylmuramidase)
MEYMARSKRRKKFRKFPIIMLLIIAIVLALGLRFDNGHVFFFGYPNLSGWSGEGAGLRYHDAHGKIVKDAFREIGTDRYLFNADGSLYKGEKKIKGKFYYFRERDGAMLREKEHEVDGKWFYYTADGTRFGTGWVELADGRKVYFKGKNGMQYGEQTVKGKPYLLDISTGGMLTGTAYFLGQKYTIANSGVVEKKEKMKIWRGIDVSSHKGMIDWGAVADEDVQFAIIRAGYITSEDTTVFKPDQYFVRNVHEAQRHGISVGAYIYLYGFTEDRIFRGIEDFGRYATENRCRFDLPVFLDVEDEKYFKPGSNELGGYDYRTELVRSGMEKLRDEGYQPGFYTFKEWAEEEFDAQSLFDKGYPFWLAVWYKNDKELKSSVMTWKNGYPDLWQYRDTGRVPGINGAVDMNYLYWDIMDRER